MQTTQQHIQDLIHLIDWDDRQTYIVSLSAIKTEMGDDGKSIARSGAAISDKYQAQSFEADWRSIRPGHHTLGTLVHLSGQKKAQPFYKKKNSPSLDDAIKLYKGGQQLSSLHPYIISKDLRVQPDARQRTMPFNHKIFGNRPALLIPNYSDLSEVEFCGVEIIGQTETGEFKKITWGRKGFKVIGECHKKSTPVIVCEGYATGLAYNALVPEALVVISFAKSLLDKAVDAVTEKGFYKVFKICEINNVDVLDMTKEQLATHVTELRAQLELKS